MSVIYVRGMRCIVFQHNKQDLFQQKLDKDCCMVEIITNVEITAALKFNLRLCFIFLVEKLLEYY